MDSNNVLTWLSFADADIDTAQLLHELRPTRLEIICYHCEQAVEKYLKGFLVAVKCLLQSNTPNEQFRMLK